MKLTIKKSLQALLVVPVLALGLAFISPITPSTSAINATDGANAARGDGQTDCLVDNASATCTDDPIFKTITNVLLFIIGAVSVIMLIIGGIRYTVSGGDSAAVTSAKNTILYAVVGIIVSLLAFAVVNFVLTSFAT